MRGHQWVGAALVGMGAGDTSRAEHAARTGRHVVRAATTITVLEVYCEGCRVAYEPQLSMQRCEAALCRTA